MTASIPVVQTYLATNRPADAAAALGELLREEPGDPRLLRLGVQVALAQDDPAAAERIARRAIAADPDEEHGYRLLSMVLRRRGQRAAASEAARTAVRLAPELWLTHAQLAHTGIGIRRQRWAVEAAAEAIRLAPNESQPHAMAGWVELGRRRPGRARPHFRAALAIDPQSGDAQRGLAAATGAGASASTALRGLAVDPTDARSMWLLHAGARRSLVLLSTAIIALSYIANLAIRAQLNGATPLAGLLPIVAAGVPVAIVVWGLYLRRATGARFRAFVRALPRCLPLPLGPLWAVAIAGAGALVIAACVARSVAFAMGGIGLGFVSELLILLGRRMRNRSR